MGAEVKARITVDAQKALQNIENLNKDSGFTSQAMSKMAKELGQVNASLKDLEGSANSATFKSITDQLEKQATAYTLVYNKSEAASKAASDYRNTLISLVKAGSATKDQMDVLVRGYNNYSTAAESAKTSNEAFNKSLGGSVTKLLSVAKNILKFQNFSKKSRQI